MQLAYRGLEAEPAPPCDAATPALLTQGYRACTEVIRAHSRTFLMASALLPRRKRAAARALYAFCRLSDDLVDGPDPASLAELEAWRRRALGDCPAPDDLVVAAWQYTRIRYGIPMVYAEQLLEGVARDLTQTRYTTFDELTEYCYGVASTVGLMAMHIIGFTGPEAIPYAVRLGVALQLTNILRDVGEDWAMGRLYLPLNDLADFGLTEADVATFAAEGRVDERWRALMRFEIARVRWLYERALPGIAMLHRDGRFAIAAAAELYRAILDDLEAHGMDNITRRAHVSTFGKLRRLPGIWRRAMLAGHSRSPQSHRKHGVF